MVSYFSIASFDLCYFLLTSWLEFLGRLWDKRILFSLSKHKKATFLALQLGTISLLVNVQSSYSRCPKICLQRFVSQFISHATWQLPRRHGVPGCSRFCFGGKKEEDRWPTKPAVDSDKARRETFAIQDVVIMPIKYRANKRELRCWPKYSTQAKRGVLGWWFHPKERAREKNVKYC